MKPTKYPLQGQWFWPHNIFYGLESLWWRFLSALGVQIVGVAVGLWFIPDDWERGAFFSILGGIGVIQWRKSFRFRWEPLRYDENTLVRLRTGERVEVDQWISWTSELSTAAGLGRLSRWSMLLVIILMKCLVLWLSITWILWLSRLPFDYGLWAAVHHVVGLYHFQSGFWQRLYPPIVAWPVGIAILAMPPTVAWLALDVERRPIAMIYTARRLLRNDISNKGIAKE